MPAFFLSLLLCALVTAAGRESVRVARLSGALGSGTGLLFAVVASSVLSSALAAFLGSRIAPILAADAKLMFVAFALGIAGIELALLKPRRAPVEPTRSTGAILLVLLAAQITDAARFCIMAIAVSTAAPAMAAAGGAVGSAAALIIASIAARNWEDKLPLAKLRYLVGFILAIAGLVTAMSARGIIF